jgi:hypothetical protein
VISNCVGNLKSSTILKFAPIPPKGRAVKFYKIEKIIKNRRK